TAVRELSLHGRAAGSGSADSDERRDAREQLSALADCVRGDLRDRDAVARFWPASPARGGARLSETRAALRRHQRFAGGASAGVGASPREMTRVISGVVLAAAALAAILFLPFPALRVIACVVAGLAADEYVRITSPARGLCRW